MRALELGGVRWSWVGVLAQVLQLGDFGLIVLLLSLSLRFAVCKGGRISTTQPCRVVGRMI